MKIFFFSTYSMIFIFVVDKMNLPIAVVGHEELLNPYNFIRVKPFSHY